MLCLVDVLSVVLSLFFYSVVVVCGFFDVVGDIVLLKEYVVEIVVCKNVGGIGVEVKIYVVWELGLLVVMIDRFVFLVC